MSVTYGAYRPSLDAAALRWLRFGLMLICFGSGSAIAFETLSGAPDAAAAREPRKKALPASVETAPLRNVDEALVDQMLERPLFNPGRRPPAPPPAPALVAVAAPKPEWTWRLAGVMVGPEEREALFTRKDEKRTVSEGQMIDGWTLAAIHPDAVVLNGDDGEKTLHPQPVEIVARGNRLLAAAARNAAIAPSVIAAKLNQSKAALGTAVAMKVAAEMAKAKPGKK